MEVKTHANSTQTQPKKCLVRCKNTYHCSSIHFYLTLWAKAIVKTVVLVVLRAAVSSDATFLARNVDNTN